MRFPVVLFDFDGTVVDSGGIILASMRHATETVLARSYSEQELMANVGGPGLEAQMEAFAPDRVEELVRVYRAHNEPLHDELEAFAGIEDALTTLRDEGRLLGLVTAKRRVDRRPRVRAAADRALLRHRRRRRRDRAAQAGPGAARCSRSSGSRASADQAAYVGDSPYDMQAAKAGGLYAVGVTWGGIHDRAALGDADVVVDTAEELLAEL